MRVVLFGYGEMGASGLEFLLGEKETVAGVITHHDDPRELRPPPSVPPGGRRWFRSLAELAAAAGLRVFFGEDHDAKGLEELVRGLAPDLILSFYYRHLIPMPVLDLAPRGALNLHGSLLPRLRGRAPLNWALVEGEERAGVTLHHMVARPDAGDIVAQRGFGIGPRDTALVLFNRAVAETRVLLREIWPQVRAGTAPRIPQDHRLATYRGRRTPEDGRVDWSLPTRRIDGLVRAVTEPFPGAFSFLEGRKLMIWSGIPAEGRGPPGSVIAEGLVATGDGAYRIEQCNYAEAGAGEPRLRGGMKLGDER